MLAGHAAHTDWTTLIARAILAERERCAKLAEQERIAWMSSEYQGGFNDACNAVARAIRNGEAPVELHRIPHRGTVKS
jgi:hypothetical protein